jgi:hypothetical protein
MSIWEFIGNIVAAIVAVQTLVRVARRFGTAFGPYFPG